MLTICQLYSFKTSEINITQISKVSLIMILTENMVTGIVVKIYTPLQIMQANLIQQKSLIKHLHL